MKKRLILRIHGRVQGVYFRHSAGKKARELGLTGFVRNEADGSVYVEADGEIPHLEEFLEWCRIGPPLASVERVDESFEEANGEFDGFAIR